MAEVPVTIVGFVAPLGKSAEDQPYPAVITGRLSKTGLGIGGGPIPPPAGGVPVYPAHPIVLPPDPGHPPPLLPTHPIVLPPIDIPPPDGGEEQDKWQVQAYWTPENGWGIAVVPGPGATVPTPSKK